MTRGHAGGSTPPFGPGPPGRENPMQDDLGRVQRRRRVPSRAERQPAARRPLLHGARASRRARACRPASSPRGARACRGRPRCRPGARTGTGRVPLTSVHWRVDVPSGRSACRTTSRPLRCTRPGAVPGRSHWQATEARAEPGSAAPAASVNRLLKLTMVASRPPRRKRRGASHRGPRRLPLCERDPADHERAAEQQPRGHGLAQRQGADGDGQRRHAVEVGHRARGLQAPQRDAPRDVAGERGTEAERDERDPVTRVERPEAIDRAGVLEGDEQQRPHETSGRGEGNQVVAGRAAA